MGACNSNLEQRCNRQMRRTTKARATSSSSSSPSSSPSSSNPNRAKANTTSHEVDSRQNNDKEPTLATSDGAAATTTTATQAETKPDTPTNESQPTSKPTQEERKERLAKLKEGVDFIETEEDAEAVESAVVRIQSTFRGKKIRSKLNKPRAPPAATEKEGQSAAAESASTGKEAASSQKEDEEDELKKGVATMQELLANLPEDEVERAATKIQAGFKGYKTRKELEGKLAGANSSGSQQMVSQQEAANQ